MGKPTPMETALHPWRTVHQRTGRRFALGLAIALSFTLVAFEWQTRTPPLAVDTWWDDRDDFVTEILPPVVIERIVTATKPAPKRRGGPVVAVPDNTVEQADQTTDTPVEEPVDGTRGEGLVDAPPTDHTSPAPGPMAYGLMQGRRPHFRDCLLSDPDRVDACTEARIGRHLERHFKVPQGVRGPVRTTITFEIDTLGQVGLLVCAPRVEKAVEAEVQRVIRSLPRFEPGCQGTHKVPVYYQIPLSVRTR